MTNRLVRITLASLLAAALSTSLLAPTSAAAAKGFKDVAKPTISGTKAVGKTLTAVADATTTPTASSVTYKWLRNGKSISKATKASYTLKASDKGKKISVTVCYKKSKYSTKCVTSKNTGEIAAGTLTIALPSIAGTVRVGATLTAKPGKWTSGTAFKYQWLRDGKSIPKATKATYKLVTADKNHKISVKVTGSKSGYKSVSKTSKQTAAVAGAFTASQEQAIRMANSYLEFTSFSRQGLIDQLEYEGFSNADAVFAVDHISVNWNAQAVRTAESYLDFTAFSRAGLIDQLEYEGFTNAQAVYGVDHITVDWNAQAVRMAQSYLEYTAFSRDGLIGQLEYEGFSNEQAVYAANAVGL